MTTPQQASRIVCSLGELRYLDASSQEQRVWAEDQLARFNLWADNLGVFAEGLLSVNHRLEKNAHVTGIINQLLVALSANINYCG